MLNKTTTRIKPNTSVEQIRRGLGIDERASKRESERRRRRLEKSARWISGKKVKVFFQPKGASCKPAPSGASYDLEVNIPTDEHDQPATDLDPTVWDFVFQKAELIHELGHVLYTDFETFEEYVEEFSDLHEKRLFQRLFNINEDGAIERQLAADYNVGNDLEIKNANLMVQGDPGRVGPGGSRVLNFTDALECILLDWAKYDTERADKLLDPAVDEYQFDSADTRSSIVELLTTLEDMTREIVTEPKAAERVKVTYKYFQELLPEIEEHGEVTEESALMNLMQAFPNDGDVYVVMPGEPPEDAEALEPDEDDTIIFMDPGDLDSMKGEKGKQYGTGVANDGEADISKDVKGWSDAVERSERNLQMVTGNCSAEGDTWARAEQYAKKYEKEFRRALQRERESKTRRGERAGRPDTQALWQLQMGKSRVFENEYEPDEKDYSVVLLLDRSGSMGGDAGHSWIVDEAEAVTAGLSMALEAVGAETAIMSVSGGQYLEKSFDEKTEAKREVLTRGHSANGTPLGAALDLTLERLKDRAGTGLVLAVTDGKPTDKYKPVLERATVPVAGVYFRKDEPDIEDVRGLYHRIQSASKDTVAQTVERMIRRLLV